MQLKTVLLSAALLMPISVWCQSSAAATKVDPALNADIRRLQEVSGFRKLFSQQMSQMANMMAGFLRNSQGMPPQAVEEFSDRFKKKFTVEEVINFAVPIYAKNFSDSEIKQIIDYQMSPIGRKVATVMPGLQKELMEAGQSRGQELGQQIGQDLAREHPDWFKKAGTGPAPKP